MDHRHGEYFIVAEAEQDRDNLLYRAQIFISTIRDGVSVTLKQRQPSRGTFARAIEAEVHGVTWAIDWATVRSPG